MRRLQPQGCDGKPEICEMSPPSAAMRFQLSRTVSPRAVLSTCSSSFMRSTGAVAVLLTAPATPATRSCSQDERLEQASTTCHHGRTGSLTIFCRYRAVNLQQQPHQSTWPWQGVVVHRTRRLIVRQHPSTSRSTGTSQSTSTSCCTLRAEPFETCCS